MQYDGITYNYCETALNSTNNITWNYFLLCFPFDRLLALFIPYSPSLSRYGNNIQEKGGQTMMITLQRQIESVGLHQPLIGRVADRVQRRCSCIRFHRRQRALRQREARLQTDRHRERRPRQVHSAFKHNEILGGYGDPDRHRGIIHFHPLAQTAPRRLLASLCWRLKLSGYHSCTISPMNKKLRWKSEAESHQVAVGVKQSVTVRLQFVAGSKIGRWMLTSTYRRLKKFACFCAGQQIAEEWFHLKSNEECPGAAPQLGFVKRANGKWQHLCQQCGTHSGDKAAVLCILGIKTTVNIEARAATTSGSAWNCDLKSGIIVP